MRTLTLSLLLTSAVATGAALAQSEAPPPAGSRPPPLVPSGGRGMPDHTPGTVPTVPSGGRGMSDVNGAHDSDGTTDLVDVNSASAATLQGQLGLSTAEAQAVVRYRRQHGMVKSQAEIAEIPGITQAGAEKMKGRVHFGTGNETSPNTH